jgi:hypothetical protein
MPISVACNQCGKRLKVPDNWVGKKAKCPGCSATFIVSADGAAEAPVVPAFAPTVAKPKMASPGIHLSGGMIAFFFVVFVIASIVAGVYFGPVKAKQAWEAAEPKAEADVTDVVQRGLESYLSQAGMDLSKAHSLPQVRQVDFLVTMISLSAPKVVGFHGTTTQGDFKGVYIISSGEVEAECEVGGVTFAGLSSAYKHGNTTFQVTGRKTNGQLTVEVNGKNAVVVYPKTTEE